MSYVHETAELNQFFEEVGIPTMAEPDYEFEVDTLDFHDDVIEGEML